jgi:hypothetical protein
VALLKHFLTVLADQDCWFSHWWRFQFFDVPAADNYTSRRLNFSIAVVRRMLRWQTGRKSASLVPTVRMYCHVFRGNPVIESLAELSQPFLNLPYVRRTRRNHGLEHATVHVLNKPVSGRSDAGGFWLMGDVSTSEVEAAAREALRRMQNGEHQLAVHPNCGTGLVTTGIMASLAGLLGTVGMKRNPTDYMARLPTIVLLTIGAILVSQPLGLKLQEHFTTLGDPGDLQILSVRRESMTSLTGRPIILHRVDTTSS